MKKLFIILFSFLLVGCSSFSTLDDINTEEETPVIVEEDEGVDFTKDELVVSMERIYNFNPLLVEDENTRQVMGLLFLNIAELTHTNEVELVIGDSYTFNPETNTGTLVLKDNLLWSNGEKITADDVVYSYNTLLNAPDTALYKENVSNISGCYEVDSRTINFNVSEAQGGIPYFLLVPIISSNNLDSYETYDGVHFSNVISSGPYMAEEFLVNGNIELVDNPNDDMNLDIKTAEIRVQSNGEQSLNAFEEGLTNYIQEDVDSWSKYHDDRNVNIVNRSTRQMEFIGFNYETSAGMDYNFRKSVESIIDFDSLVNNIYLGFCDYSYSLFPSEHFAYNTDTIKPEYNLTEGKNLLANSTYAGEEITVLVNSENNERVTLAKELIRQLNNIDVNAVLIDVPYDQYINMVNEKNYHILVGGTQMTPMANYDDLLGRNNIFNYYDESVFDNLYTLYNAATKESYTSNAINLQNKINSECIIIPILFKNYAVITDSNIIAPEPTSYINVFYKMDEWLID